MYIIQDWLIITPLNYKGKVNITYCMKLVKIDPAKLLMIFKHGDYNSQLSTKSSQTVLMHATSPCIKVVLEYTQNKQTGSNIDITFNSDRPASISMSTKTNLPQVNNAKRDVTMLHFAK